MTEELNRNLPPALPDPIITRNADVEETSNAAPTVVEEPTVERDDIPEGRKLEDDGAGVTFTTVPWVGY